MEIPNLIPHIEALIFASEKPLTSAEITDLINQAFGLEEDKVVIEQVEASLQGIVEKYSSEFYPFEIRQSGGGWQFLTKKEYHKTVAQLNGEKFLKKLSAAAIETLAIIAYKQPITKGEIEAIRGVSSDYSVQKLLEKELIVISGRNEKLPGHPLVYSTSKTFMDYFGLNSPDDMPKIKEVLADQIVEPTIVNHTEFEQSETLAVSDTGELLDAALTDDRSEEQHLNGHAFKELDPDAVDDSSENLEASQNPEPDVTHQANNETIDEEGATEEEVEAARLFIDEMHDEEAADDVEELTDEEDDDNDFESVEDESEEDIEMIEESPDIEDSDESADDMDDEDAIEEEEDIDDYEDNVEEEDLEEDEEQDEDSSNDHDDATDDSESDEEKHPDNNPEQ